MELTKKDSAKLAVYLADNIKIYTDGSKPFILASDIFDLITKANNVNDINDLITE